MVRIEVENIDQIEKEFQNYEKLAASAIKKAVDETALAIQNDAKSILRLHLNMFISGLKKIKGKRVYQNYKGQNMARKRTGALIASILRQTTPSGELATDLGELEAAAGSNLSYAPYWEFGTGQFVDIMDGWQDVAIKYKGKKKVTGFAGASYLGKATLQQSKNFQQRVQNNLNKIRTKLT